MIIQIAFGVLLGYLFIFLFIAIIAGFIALMARLDCREEEWVREPRLRPNSTRYEETQELKKRAKEDRPDHWRQK